MFNDNNDYIRDEDPVLAKKPDPGLCTSNEGRFLKVYWMNILDNIKSLLFCFHTFGVRRTIDVLDSENQPGSGKIRTGSGALGLTGDVWHQKYKNKKEGVKNYLTYSFNRLLKISLSLRYRAPDPVFGQNRILIPEFIGSGWKILTNLN